MIHLSIATHNHLFASKHNICSSLQAGKDNQSDIIVTILLQIQQNFITATFLVINFPHPSRIDSRQQ